MIADRARPLVVVGEPDAVGAALRRAQLDGRLCAVRSVEELPAGRVRVVADVVGQSAPRWRRARPWVLGAAVAVLAGVLVLLVVTVVALVSAAAAWVSTHLSLIVGVGVGLLLLACVGGRACPGLHCGGCRG